MSALTLTLSRAPGHPLDCSSLIPEQLLGMSAKALRQHPLLGGPAPIKLGDCFDIEGKPSDHLIIVNKAGVVLHRLGAGMTNGQLEIRGAAGLALGQGLAGGQILLRGSAGDFVGAGMRKGLIEITGDAGDYCGGAIPGTPFGLKGGLIVVGGNAGRFLGDRQRRGVVAVKGNVGDYAGVRMFSGTLIAFGRCGEVPGLGMRRGSILLINGCERVADSFGSSGRLELAFIGLAARKLNALHKVFRPLLSLPNTAERMNGDLGNGGKGELILFG